MTTTAEPLDDAAEPSVLPMEFMQLPLIHEDTLDEPSLHVINVVSTIPHALRERIRIRGNWDGNVIGTRRVMLSGMMPLPISTWRSRTSDQPWNLS